MSRRVLLLLCPFFVVCFFQGEDVVHPRMAGAEDNKIAISSTSFADGSPIPKRYTCDGEDVSPPLAWTGLPNGTKSLALICDDPDAPRGTWTHWVLFNIPANVKELRPNIPPERTIENGATHGMNDFRELGYGGPCPPRGMHRYYFKLYALDTHVNLDSGITRGQLLKAMEGHILGVGQLMGTYKR